MPSSYAELERFYERLVTRARSRGVTCAITSGMAWALAGATLEVQHQTRVRCAEKCLPPNPLADYGVARLINEARSSLRQLVNSAALAWLPDVREHFKVSLT